MSLILEALRKSEAERRRGQAPDLAQELPPPPPQSPPLLPRRGAWLAGALLLVVAGGLVFWQWRAPPAAPATVAIAMPAATTPAPAPAAPRMVAPALAPPAAPAPTPTDTQATRAPVPSASAPAATPTPAPAAVAPPAPAGSAATAASDLPDADAAGLPPMRLSMHVWDAEPARRFVILDGQRMAEGDRRNGVQVIEIRRDGVIVERDGVRARLPLP